LGWGRSHERYDKKVREEGGRGDVLARDGGRRCVWWCLQGLRGELGRKERECGVGYRLKALKYNMANPGMVSYYTHLVSLDTHQTSNLNKIKIKYVQGKLLGSASGDLPHFKHNLEDILVK
jgi:hypothetical protein